ncbi:hypothetical protein ACFWDI_40825 [Streptomyces sp. NPDC060064]|uniref:hypothetical protein n=1 Tax=Streptomyces sp. NPDC060064 TaxID=3347049 RepID=UPI0036BE5A2A
MTASADLRPHGRIVRSVQVMADIGGPGVGTLVIGAGDQIVHQLTAQPQLDLGEVSQMGQFQGKRGARVGENLVDGALVLRRRD